MNFIKEKISNTKAKHVTYIFIFFLLIWSVWFFISGEDFEGGILPELIGFSLEGIFFIGILTVLQKKTQKKRQHLLHQNTIHVMGPFLSRLGETVWADGIYQEHPSKVFLGQFSADDTKELYSHFSNNISRLTSPVLFELSRELKEFNQLIPALTPIAAELSEEHFRIWTNIASSSGKISNMELGDGVFSSVNGVDIEKAVGAEFKRGYRNTNALDFFFS